MGTDGPQPAQRKKLFAKHLVRKIFLEDWGLKLLALVITFALWLGVTGLSTPTTRRLTVPLNLSIAGNAQIVNSVQQDVEIEISGDKRRIEQINRAELAASVDLTDMEAGNWVVSLSPETTFVSLPQGVRLTDVAPSRIAVNLELVEEKELAIRVETKGSPPAGFEIYSSTAFPARVAVRGPASVVRALEDIRTEPIDIGGKRDDFVARQTVVAPPSPQVAVLNTVVDVTLRIGEKRVERMLLIPVETPPGASVTFVLFGPRSLLAKAKSEMFSFEYGTQGDDTGRVILPADWQNSVEVRDVNLRRAP